MGVLERGTERRVRKPLGVAKGLGGACSHLKSQRDLIDAEAPKGRLRLSQVGLEQSILATLFIECPIMVQILVPQTKGLAYRILFRTLD